MIKNLLFISALFVSILTLNSCDGCRGLLGGEKIVCSNGGTCNDGACDCLKGYFGPNCEQTDSCELLDVTCFRGECDNGICLCESGYEGEDCSIESRKKYLGVYNVIESCIGLDTTWNYNITLEANVLDGAVINITNLFSYSNFPVNGYFSRIEAVVEAGAEKFNIPNQRPDDGTKSISGSGELIVVDSNTTNIVIDYVTTNGNKSYSCQLTGVLIAQ